MDSQTKRTRSPFFKRKMTDVDQGRKGSRKRMKKKTKKE